MKEPIVIILSFLITALLHGLIYLLRPLQDGGTESLSLYYPSLAITAIAIIICLYLTARQYLLHHFPDSVEMARVKAEVVTEDCRKIFGTAERVLKEQQNAGKDKGGN